MIFILFVLGSESDCLVDLLFSETLAEKGSTVFLLGLAVHLLRQVLQSLHLVVFVHDLAALHIDLSLQFLVRRHCGVQTQLLVFNRMGLTV